MAKTKDKETPLMKQYNAIKAKYPDAMLLFRIGDFYETFGKDAIKCANVLGITLTARNNGGSKLELAGFPHHSLNTYLPKLVRSGLRVAICDQLEAPSKEKKIVKRGVTELVTPGVTLNDQILDHKSNNFLAAVHFDKKKCGVAFLDVSTGEFLVGEGSIEYVDKLLHSFKPTEVLFQRNKQKKFIENFGNQFYTFCLEDWAFTQDFGTEILQKQFETSSLKGFGIDDLSYAVCAAGAALHYLSDTQHNKTKHITVISRIEEDKYVWLDRFTIRNLELIYSPNENAKTLIDVLDHTISPMGARLLKRWVALPLKDIQPINDRLNAVNEFVNNEELSLKLVSNIKEIGDLERLISKVATARINPREVVQLKRALTVIEPIKQLCATSKNEALSKIGERLNPCEIIRNKIEHTINDEPPVAVQKGNVIKDGVSKELDELRKILNSGKEALVEIQKREIENTGISSLKIGFNNVFGYYIEVRNTHKDKVPESWHRKQTLTQAERYITEELKEYESKILGADEKILQLETQLFNDLVLELVDYIIPIQLNAALIAQLDCLLSFAALANRYYYTRPEINDTKIIDIKDGRHPVIEQQLPIGEEYIANDVYLDDSTQQIIMITGPNMSGKSALLRQTALITLMAQIGSFVPAKSAKIGIVDKIFTRVGASDNISQGESTFMVEMNETASILNNLSDRSLILLDEIGRGTSTYDGISIAWSIAEYLHEQPKLRAKTLFATHYHELNDMTNSFKRIKNFNVSVKEIKNKIIFLRKLVQGGSNHSFGIHVARMAGMPNKMINRANEVLKQLENSHVGNGKAKKVKSTIDVDDIQLSFFQLDDPVLEQIKEELINIDINTLTPVEALMKLNEIKKSVGG
ncbi:MAG: DNA mismatch repair protein MutS [Flavobacteriales bacterium]|nr:DNA mismatch repair protein MutS [Flavobacteriales bacterium]